MANVPMCRSCDQYDDSRDYPDDVYSNDQGRCRECERKRIEKLKLTNAINRLCDLVERMQWNEKNYTE